MESYFTCNGPYGNAASSYDVFVSVRTQLIPAEGGGTEARTQAEAVAKPPTSGQRVRCASNGALEQLIGRMIHEATIAAR